MLIKSSPNERSLLSGSDLTMQGISSQAGGTTCIAPFCPFLGGNHGKSLAGLLGLQSIAYKQPEAISLGSKIPAAGGCSHVVKRCSLPGRKAMTNLDNILKSRDITLPTKVRLVKAMIFPVVMYGCESWTIKKGEHQRIDAPEL